jgi:hypothetical protein
VPVFFPQTSAQALPFASFWVAGADRSTGLRAGCARPDAISQTAAFPPNRNGCCSRN